MNRGTVLAVLRSTGEFDDVLDLAIEVAERRRARLAVIALVPEVPATAYLAVFGGAWPVEVIRRVHVKAATQVCTSALRSVPDHVPVEFRVLQGQLRRVVPAILAQGHYGAVILHRRWMRSGQLKRLGKRCRDQTADLCIAG